MNQQCKVCGEPAAGFHFGAFTCEGCKSFFGRSYNNLSSISECKNGGECVINKKNRTACKACRLRKCLLVGMSKSGSRYGRRSNWFKIHCLLQEQQQQQQQQQQQHQQSQQSHQQQNQRSPASISGHHLGQRKDEILMLGLDDYKNSTSPSISSPESHNSDSSVDVSERRNAMSHLHPGFRPLHAHHAAAAAELSALSKEMLGLPLGFPLGGMPLIPPGFLPPHGIPMFPTPYHLYGAHSPQGTPHPHSLISGHCVPPGVLQHSGIIGIHGLGGSHNNNNNNNSHSNNNNTSNNNNNNNDNNDNNDNRFAQKHNGLIGTRVSPDDIANNLQASELAYTKRFYLEAVLKSQRTPPPARSPEEESIKTNSDNDDIEAYSPTRCSVSPNLDGTVTPPPPQDNPIDLSMKNLSSSGDLETVGRRETPESSRSREEDVDMDDVSDEESPPAAKRRPAPIDLTCTKA